jgi:hypothetical protein
MMPAHAFAESQNFGGIDAAGSSSEDKDTHPALGRPKVLQVKHTPRGHGGRSHCSTAPKVFDLSVLVGSKSAVCDQIAPDDGRENFGKVMPVVGRERPGHILPEQVRRVRFAPNADLLVEQ